MLLKNQILHFRSLSGIFVSMLLILMITSCASKHEFLTSTIVPAARGFVTVKKDANQNNLIHLEVNYLAEANRLQPAKETYVVWLVTKEDVTKNIGQINNTTKTAGNSLKASFETVSPHVPTRIFITAENDPTITYPGSQIVLSTGKLN